MRQPARHRKPIQPKTPAPLKFEIEEATELLVFLISKMPHKSRHNVKALLKENVFVDGNQTSQFNQNLRPGQVVEIKYDKVSVKTKLRGLKLIFEDEYLIVIEKEAGVLSIATEKQKDNTAYSILSEYVKKEDPSNRIFVVHRLDKETSGIMMYAKSQTIQKLLQEKWNDNILERTYLAVVEGKLHQAKGTVESYLIESKALIVYSTKDEANGQKAITHYEVMHTSKFNQLLKVNLETGRKNQIRVHMQDLGHPVIGDEKYGARSNPIKRLGLHAWVLAFTHPVTKIDMRFETEVPSEFDRMF
ncbi:RluA family pseudouridine synthase [Lacihabitans lacunae]|uniref:Pseudouridine synthase n=1 Tax=Lacihabitans lacunae TaxID=1028214 RepID=A0ABV7YYP0_9BACT